MDALITDFDGVVADSEPIHLRGFTAVLADVAIALTSEDYYGKYLGFDDHDCFQAVGRDNGREFTEDQIAEMTAAKTLIGQALMAESIQPIAGIVELLAALAEAGVPMAVCSGALRDEVELCSRVIGVWGRFAAIVAAVDVTRGKPDPQGYAKALEALRAATGRDLRAGRCVVTEDSPAGISAAKELGMKVLAITSSYPAEALGQADLIVDSFHDVTLATMTKLAQQG